MDRSTIRNLIFVLTLTLVGVACSDSSTSPDGEPASVEGRVDNTNSSSQKVQSKSVEGAVVTAARVTSSGELQTIGNAEAETNAQGEFTLQIDGEAVAEFSDRVVIVAENNGQTAKAFVTSKVESGSSVTVQPITFESTSETNVFQEVVANGDADVVTKADIEAMVSTKVASDIESDASKASDFAAALAAQAEAKAEFYSRQGVEMSEEQRNNILEAKTNAMLELESRLNATTSTEEEEAALDAFIQMMATADVEAGIKATAAAKAWESSSRVLVKQSTDLSAEAKAELRKHVSYMTTFTLETAVEAQMKAAGAAESSVNSAVDAAAALRAEIKGMSNASKEEIDAVFANFNSEIEAILQNDTNVDGSAFASANTKINEDNGAKASFESSLEATLDLNLIFDAYTQFYTAVKSNVESTFTAASDAEVEAYTQLLILVNVAS